MQQAGKDRALGLSGLDGVMRGAHDVTGAEAMLVEVHEGGLVGHRFQLAPLVEDATGPATHVLGSRQPLRLLPSVLLRLQQVRHLVFERFGAVLMSHGRHGGCSSKLCDERAAINLHTVSPFTRPSGDIQRRCSL